MPTQTRRRQIINRALNRQENRQGKRQAPRRMPIKGFRPSAAPNALEPLPLQRKNLSPFRRRPVRGVPGARYLRANSSSFGGPKSRFANPLEQVGRGEGNLKPSLKGMAIQARKRRRARREARA